MTAAQRPAPVAAAARRTVGVPPAEVYAFLAHLPNHRLIGDRHLELVALADGHGGQVVIHGPLGLRRTAHTTITRTNPPHAWGGLVTIGDRTLAHVDWRITPRPGGTGDPVAQVTLTVRIAHAGPLDRILLTLGRRWLTRRLNGWLQGLDQAITRPPGA